MYARGGVADREAAIAPRRVANVDRFAAHRERDLLSRQSRVAPATRHAGQHLRLRPVPALEPERRERRHPLDLVVGEFENGRW
jgi:hypothetical protein